MVRTMKLFFLVIGCIPLLGGGGCCGLAMAVVPEEEDERLFRKGINTEGGTNPRTTVASYHERSQEEMMMFEGRVELEAFGVGTSFKAITTPLIHPTQIAKAIDPMNSKSPFITETSNEDTSKEKTPLGVAAVPPTLAKVGMGKFKDQGQPLSYHTVQLEIKGLAELSETAETEHFTEATTSHILRHWKDNTSVKIVNVKTNFIPKPTTGHSPTKIATKKEQQGCNSENVIAVQMQISVDFKTMDPIITEEIIITGAFGTSGTNNYIVSLKDSGVKSFSCIINISKSVVIHPSTGLNKEQTHKTHLVTRTNKPETLHASNIFKNSLSKALVVESKVLPKDSKKGSFNSKILRKLNECTSCTDIATPWMENNEKKCETTGLVPTKCYQSNYWKENKYCQLSCFKADYGYEGDACCDNQTLVPCNICTDEETPWMKRYNKDCSSSNQLATKCNFNYNWANRKYCQHSCFEEGNGYDNDNCCFSTETPTKTPTNHPSSFPSNKPTPLFVSVPSKVSTSNPSQTPSQAPSGEPSAVPTSYPSQAPSKEPSGLPSLEPSKEPSKEPSSVPSSSPSVIPSAAPSVEPSSSPSVEPSMMPSSVPSASPSVDPSEIPSADPSRMPSLVPSKAPSEEPSTVPSLEPSKEPSEEPSSVPSSSPSVIPSAAPSVEPSRSPSVEPSMMPSESPSRAPSSNPSQVPSSFPSSCVICNDKKSPKISDFNESCFSSKTLLASKCSLDDDWSREQYCQHSCFLTGHGYPGLHCCEGSEYPSALLSLSPSIFILPSFQPSGAPSLSSSTVPSTVPSSYPFSTPSLSPSTGPSSEPYMNPTSIPSIFPSSVPSVEPSTSPSSFPSYSPSISNQPSTCTLCSNSASPLMVEHEEDNCFAASRTLLNNMCNNNDDWNEFKYCEFSCYANGNGYVGSFCCKESEYPSVKPSRIPSSTQSEVPSLFPSTLPFADPSNVPSSFPSEFLSSNPSKNPSRNPSIFPSFVLSFEPSNDPSSFPSYSPSASIQPSSCTHCSNKAAPEIIEHAEFCETSNALLDEMCNKDDAWKEEKYCEWSCHVSGNGYKGHFCCKSSEYPSAEPSYIPSLATSQIPSLLPTIFISQEPSTAPSSFPSIQPSIFLSSSPSVILSSDPSKNPSSNPSILPSLVPSVGPSNKFSDFPSYSPSISIQPSSCTDCTNKESPTMNIYGEVCGDVLSIMATLCNKSDEWKEEKYCEYSCHENGNGYVGSFCCKPS